MQVVVDEAGGEGNHDSVHGAKLLEEQRLSFKKEWECAEIRNLKMKAYTNFLPDSTANWMKLEGQIPTSYVKFTLSKDWKKTGTN
jgi:hypothetical protein